MNDCHQLDGRLEVGLSVYVFLWSGDAAQPRDLLILTVSVVRRVLRDSGLLLGHHLYLASRWAAGRSIAGAGNAVRGC